MISVRELLSLAIEWGVPEATVERDYVMGAILRGFSEDKVLRERWIFRGGACLKKCYMETWRFPDRMDFTRMGSMRPGDTFREIVSLAGKVGKLDNIDFQLDQWNVERSPDGRSVEGTVMFRSCLDKSAMRKLRISVSSDASAEPAQQREVYHFYTDGDSPGFSVPCLSFQELLVDKLLRLAREGKAGDLYDIIHMFWRGGSLLGDRADIQVLLVRKTRQLSLPPFSYQNIAARMEDVRRDWKVSLETQMREVPPFEHVWGALPEFFAWLEGVIHKRELSGLRSSDESLMDATWNPPPAAWQWGMEVPLEAIRFAAVNRLCVELGYGGINRLIEPYSLRFSNDGNLLLYARKVDTQEIRTYRIDRIESIRVTGIPFVPVYTIEMSTGGPLLIQSPVIPLQRPSEQHASVRHPPSEEGSHDLLEDPMENQPEPSHHR